ncbi:aconitate hydratase AcnA [Streptomyces daliensis]|uniref:Aconitate hydratase AcnA n=1 Tax=Streptomyces daliensis TaxID=299421 RepID=A0A8T4IV90_9ACTN|nr:aconitate hydratase AcnA [Streptomyces daliensis]
MCGCWTWWRTGGSKRLPRSCAGTWTRSGCSRRAADGSLTASRGRVCASPSSFVLGSGSSRSSGCINPHLESTPPSESGTPAPFGEPLPEGPVAIAAITSCTNTANPTLIVQAALLAERAVRAGLNAKPWVKTSLSPGSRVVEDYLREAGLLTALERTGFHIVGFGCMTCIGNSGPLHAELERLAAAEAADPVAVLSGNRNFAGRVNPRVAHSYLASPPLVVAYALAGSVLHDFARDPPGTDASGAPVLLKDLWPTDEEVAARVAAAVRPEMFRANAARLREGTQAWRDIEAPGGTRFRWDPDSTYIRRPPHLTDLPAEASERLRVDRARVLLLLGDDVTTDHISPAGAIKADTPAGKYLTEHGIERRDFNSYGSRRGNHEVMIRGTFANIRLRNQIAPGTEGGYTRDFTQEGGPVSFIYDASQNYQAQGTPLVILAGKEYGSGSSRDWAAKGTALLGVKAVIAESYERIHRSNLIGMGVLPLQFPEGASAESLGLGGEETFSISGITALNDGGIPETVKVTTDNGVAFDAKVRIDTPGEADYYRNGGILQYVLRSLISK